MGRYYSGTWGSVPPLPRKKNDVVPLNDQLCPRFLHKVLGVNHHHQEINRHSETGQQTGQQTILQELGEHQVNPCLYLSNVGDLKCQRMIYNKPRQLESLIDMYNNA